MPASNATSGAAVPFVTLPMPDVSLELKDPRVLRALLSVPTMQRWEILRRARKTMELPELGEAGVTSFLDAHGIELRDLPPDNRLIAGALAAEGKLKTRLHAACAAYYETEPFVLPDAPQAH